MAINVRIAGDDIVVLSGFGRLMNDPRHFDASRDVHELVDRGHRRFVAELRGVGTLGPSGMGLLMTLTRLVRQHDGDLVLAGVNRSMERRLDELRMDSYWEVFDDVDAAVRSFPASA